MTATGKAPWIMYVVTLFVQSIPSVTSISLQVQGPIHRDIHQHNASRASAHTQDSTRTPSNIDVLGYKCAPDDWNTVTEFPVDSSQSDGAWCQLLCQQVADNTGNSGCCWMDYPGQCAFFPGAARVSGPSSYTALDVTAASTAIPTPATSPAPPTGAGAGASAVGDPHLQNIHGERFDLMKAGKHVLINIPRGMSAENALLRVQADARRLGGQCADMYFQKINVTGSWAEAKQTGGYHYSVSERDIKAPEWVAFGKVELKVVHGRADSGLLYLNLYVKHLGRAGFAIGGLLGEDDHEDVSVAPESCAQRLVLAGTHRDEGQALSLAVASLA